MTTSTTTSVIALTINGTALPMWATQSKAGNTYFIFREKANTEAKKVNSFGQEAPALGSTLPETVDVHGFEIALSDVLESTWTDRKTGEPQTKHYAPGERRQGEGEVEIDGVDHSVSVNITTRKDGLWQVKASARIKREGKGTTPRVAPTVESFWGKA